MEIRIGVQHVTREIVFKTDLPAEKVVEQVQTAIKDGGMVQIDDIKGRTILVPGNVVGYVEVGDTTSGPVGFVAS
ncbi:MULTISPECIES: DUF3107 domain-containing protein [Auritidibacter]|uniref:DUF3107 domain-containing protein n=1 Tax=Auritidibacter ignavus TaxID=678932 RepID=A0AAJ6AID5_9MICC|nr:MULTISPECIES: DUF3107 domain-containing protein [Auritidibacter]PXA80278.1 DUF3107 domain-containing protein [Auritidibacter sp. NML120779]AXR73132.1 DUF3107 domain-containing protein [Auritidibacter sp. NML130574]NIH71579.1 hypothetical protein [Auritidibacter ignavus]PXA77409.1 DUF3107 domain-containing protein [Auritidibacter sp. NML100628]PXA81886.1 DUF3107 domain-containing protein [Auritidibacter sp. NML120636]